ncbi:RHS repeat-associated core domain-containing protein [Pseudomonas alabamensis]|uniref:RHS repeat-associated core domain-containing protein n=1 Tax=Pseudomonas alabamensis TaxID=3064349 RepID=UPI003F64979D
MERREPGSLQEQHLRLLRQCLNQETGLYYNTFRYYGPVVGRFAQPDPIKLSGGHQRYGYAPNPESWIDPLGWIAGRTKSGIKRTTNMWCKRYGPTAMRAYPMIPQEMLDDLTFSIRYRLLAFSNISATLTWLDKKRNPCN